MGYFSRITDKSFAAGKNGETLFYPWGKSNNGYVLKDQSQIKKIRKVLITLNVVFLCALFLMGITVGWIFGIILLPFYYLLLFITVQVFTKDSEKAAPLSSSRLYWKIYFWFILVIMIYGYISEGISGPWETFDLLISSGALAGLFLYSYRKKFSVPLYWKIYFFVFIVWDISYNLIIEPKIKGEPWAFVKRCVKSIQAAFLSCASGARFAIPSANCFPL